MGTLRAALLWGMVGMVGCIQPAGPLCEPRSAVACIGLGGCSGAQQCNSSGTAYGQCDCDPGPSDGGFDAGFDAGSDAGVVLCRADDPDWCFGDAGTLFECGQATREACGEIQAIAVDSSHLLWSNPDGDAGYELWVKSLNGGSPTLLERSSNFLFSVVLRDGFAWAASYGSSSSGVLRVPLDGGPSRMLATEPWAFSLAVNDSHAYWGSGVASGNVYRVPLDGGVTELVAPGEGEVFSVALDDTAVYWTGFSSGSIRRRDLGGGAASTLFSQMYPGKVLVRQGWIYWAASTGPGDIWRAPLPSGTPQLVAGSQQVPRHFDVDDNWVYWFSGAADFSPMLYRVPLSGGAPQPLLNTKYSGPVAVGATRLYFSANGLRSVPVVP